MENASVSDRVSPVTPVSSLAENLSHSTINSGTKKPTPLSPSQKSNLSSPTTSKSMLLSSGLRVTTPPTRTRLPRRLQLVPDENNPLGTGFSTSTSPFSFGTARRLLSDDSDQSSQDSGCAMSVASEDSSGFRFAEPCGFAPKRLNSMESPRRCLRFSSENSVESLDDGFLEFLGEAAGETDDALLADDAERQLPLGLGSLISGQIISQRTPTPKKRVSISPGTPVRAVSRIRSRTVSSHEEFSLKRPLRDRVFQEEELSPKKNLKRIKSENRGTLFQYGFWKSPKNRNRDENCRRPLVESLASPSDSKICDDKVSRLKSGSPSSDDIKQALQRSTQEDLIGDFTRPFALPLVKGKHMDLKHISTETLAGLIRGEFSDTVDSFRIIDCRYPYEFDGGHIKGAENLYTCEHITRVLLDASTRSRRSPNPDKRQVLVFHCEFSSERGPFLSRFLRQEDRADNEYPQLHYPELYILKGGYSTFYQEYVELCEPKGYLKMSDPAYSSDLKHFRAKSKSWAPGSYKKQTMRSLSRLGF